LEGSDYAIIEEVLTMYLPGRTEAKHGKKLKIAGVLAQILGYKSTVLFLGQPIW
jgi:hypothetical protein